MSAILAAMEQARAARARGDFAEALRLNLSLHQAPPPDDPEERHIRLFSLWEWSELAAAYPPARQALQALRDKQSTLLATDTEQRYRLITEINRHLGDNRHTLTLFRLLETKRPDAAHRVFHGTADVLLECGAVEELQRHLPEPLEGTRYRAQYLDAVAAERFPRRLGEAQAFVNDLRLQCGVLALLGKAAEAEELKILALSLIRSDEAREMVRAELESPGELALRMEAWQASQARENS